jgi:SAF domain
MTVAGHARSRRAGGGPAAPGGRRAGGRRVRPAAGVLLLVVVCALAVAEGRVRAGSREPVLALARPVAAGQVITTSDLRVVDVSVAGPVSVVPAAGQDRVTGRTATASLPAGSLLAAGDVGAPSPGRGQAWLGVALMPGCYPPGLSAGQHVGVLAASAPGSRGPARLAGYAVVVSVTAAPVPGAAGEIVVGLDLSRDVVPRVAAASAGGRVSLAVIPAGR